MTRREGRTRRPLRARRLARSTPAAELPGIRAYAVDGDGEDLARRPSLVGAADVLARHPIDEREVLIRLDVDDAAAHRDPVPWVLGADDRHGDLLALTKRLALARFD